MSFLLQLTFNGLALGSLYAVVALGFALIYNTTRIFHIAHGIVYTGAGYALFSLFTRAGLSLWLSIPFALTLAIALGLVVEALVYRPLEQKKAPAAITLISSLGVYIFLQNFIALVYGNQTQVLLSEPDVTYRAGSLVLSRLQLIEIASLVVVFALFFLFSRYTKLGKSIKAFADNPLLAEVVGINTRRLRLWVFAIGSALAGAGAVLSGLDVGIDPNVGFTILLVAVVSTIVGGVGLFEGALVGGLLIGLLQGLAIWRVSARWENTIVFLVLILFLLFRPQGILSHKRRLEEATV